MRNKRRMKLLLLGIVAVALAVSQPLAAATATSNVSVSATVSATAKLELSRTTVAFIDADPETTPSIPATGGAITVTAKGKTSAGASITLTLLAAGDLISGSDTIGIDNVTWTADGSGFVAGTMSSTLAQSVASWTNSGNRQGTVAFALANSWEYKTGSYTASATYTLTAP